MDTTALGWAVQRTGAGREKAGEPVDPHAGIVFHARRGAQVERGQPLATLYATTAALLAEPDGALESRASDFADAASAGRISRMSAASFTRESARSAISARCCKVGQRHLAP